jgi:PIN domain nuclease of toxin-antitoxin system
MGSVVAPASYRDDGRALLVDTHVWIWYVDGAPLSTPLEALLRRANAEHRLLVSDISAWEVATKASRGRLDLAVDPAFWIHRAERMPGIVLVPLDREMLLLGAMLPGTIHGDPADRMIVATALLRACPLVTADRRIVDYARREKKVALSVVEAR